MAVTGNGDVSAFEEYQDGDLEKALEESGVVEEVVEEVQIVEDGNAVDEMLLAEAALAEDAGEELPEDLPELLEALPEELPEDLPEELELQEEVFAELGVEDSQEELKLEEEVLAELGVEDSQEAIVLGDDEDEDNEGVQDHLMDAVEGTLRLKRLLSQDDEAPEEALAGKKRRTKKDDASPAADEVRIQQLLTRWGLLQDKVTRYVLESLTPAELQMLGDTYVPDKFNQWRGPGELIVCQIAAMKERVGAGGGAADSIVAFRHRWKMNADEEAMLRGLSHKDLRYVMQEFDGETSLEDFLPQASSSVADESIAEGTLPDEPGQPVVSRFNRLDLIDPLADCAVFGDANLSFALKLAKHREALGDVGRVIATTFETLECLRERYQEIDATIKTLEGLYSEVYHGVDCTRIAVDSRFHGMEGSLGAVYYNFPHAGAVSGFFDGHPCVNWRHENLMRLFFRALRSFMKPGGLVKVSSSKGAVGVRCYYITEAAQENEFVHIETMPFQDWHLHRYGRSYGDKRDVYRRPGQGEGYNVQRAEADMVYTFKYAPSGETLPPQSIRMPPKFGVLKSCPDGPFRTLFGEARERHATALYKRFVTECSGTHVG
ncbi:Ranbp2 [Symbiodinium natans]|uniref:Ranbp2 protein n=1 Tax=Symbiodinium natans TaxID=878477 RepID=A0A812HLA9_9DINO|nr:Ranbp2 [Symbiodinium natans]